MDLLQLQQLAGVRLTRMSLDEARAEVPPWDLQTEAGPRRRGGSTSWKKNTAGYQGVPTLFSPRYQAMLKQGYLDYADADPQFTTRYPGSLAKHTHHVARLIGSLLISKDGRGITFVRDPEDAILHNLKARNPIAKLKELAMEGLVWVYGEAEPENDEADPEITRKWAGARDAARAAKYDVKAVQGKSGKGYQIKASPSPAEINKKYGVSF